MFYPQFTCKVRSYFHFPFLFDVLITVKPTITLRSSSPVVVNESDATSLVCVARGRPQPTVIWRHESAIVQRKSSDDNTNYVISSATKDHAGTYTCTARVTTPGIGSFSTEYTVSDSTM